MSKKFYSLGLMSGTSMDGVDASIVQSDGKTNYKVILDKYFKYSKSLYIDLSNLRDKIKNFNDLKKNEKKIKIIEKKITLFHASVVKKILKRIKLKIDLIGFHGQTIFHDSKRKISRQLGDGALLSKIIKKNVVYDFRQNDIKNGGEGAPLTPVFHKLLISKYKLKLPTLIINIGGITNVTWSKPESKIISYDIGPGNCLIDKWMRVNSNKKYDKSGSLAKKGKINNGRLQYLFNYYNKMGLKNLYSYDIYDFNSQIKYLKGLSLKDGAATLNAYTTEILSKKIISSKPLFFANIILSGGGRKNKFLIKTLEKKIKFPLKLIDEYKINGDFVESQAFAYLAIRSYLNLPISFPETTNVKKPCTGGVLVKYN
tara:strand:+ start:467 stop:1579 length:1113 start_codon:yes stop_codon:yes gene_type:complete